MNDCRISIDQLLGLAREGKLKYEYVTFSLCVFVYAGAFMHVHIRKMMELTHISCYVTKTLKEI